MKNWIQRRIDALLGFLMRQQSSIRYKDCIASGILEMGKHSYGRPIIHNYKGSEAKVIIGSYCSIAPEVTFITGGIHPLNWVSTFPFRHQWQLPGSDADGMPATKGNIVVGSDVWIGTGSLILSGVKIGHGAVIGARSVVTKDVAAYSLVAGSPAAVVRYRFPEDVIQKLLAIRWWEWDEDKVLCAVPMLSSSSIDEFLRLYGEKTA